MRSSLPLTVTFLSFALAVGCSDHPTGPAAPTQLKILVQPFFELVSQTPSPYALQVALQDEKGNTVTNSTAIVTIAIVPGTGAAGATLGGTVSVLKGEHGWRITVCTAYEERASRR